MSVKQCQFAYDSEWLDRKTNIAKKVTWNEIQQAGIIALEAFHGTKDEPIGIAVMPDGEIMEVTKIEEIIPEKKELPEKTKKILKDSKEEIANIEPFEINVTDSIIDALDGNTWMELRDHVCFPPNIVRFRKKDEGVQTIKGKKRFQITADPKFEEDGAVYYTVKPV